MSIEQHLEDLSRDDAAFVALQLGIKVHHLAKKETIVSQILNKPESGINAAILALIEEKAKDVAAEVVEPLAGGVLLEALEKLAEPEPVAPAPAPVQVVAAPIAAPIAAPVPDNTPDDVRKAIQHVLNAKGGFEAVFPDDGTWIFRYAGAEDSGTLKMPIRIIVQKAERVSRGRYSLPILGRDSSDTTYTGKIIA
jgi:hypothetical protein